MRGYVKTFKIKEGDNKLMSFCLDDEKSLQKYKGIWTKVEDVKSIELNAFRVYDDKYIKTRIKTCSDKIYNNVRDLHVPEDDIEFESFTVISIDTLLVYDKHI